MNKISKWVFAPIFGLIWILLQLEFPDPVPEFINNLITMDNFHYTGLNIALNIVLIIYVLGGWVLLIGGIIVTAMSYSRSDSK